MDDIPLRAGYRARHKKEAKRMGVSSKWRIGFSVALCCSGIVASGCSSDDTSGGPPAGSDATTDGANNDGAGGEAATSDSPSEGSVLDGSATSDAISDAPLCSPIDASIATVAAGSLWGCYQAACSMQLAACAADCICNDAMLGALRCAADGGSGTACFLAAIGKNIGVSSVVEVGNCLVMGAGAAMCGGDAGTDAAADATRDSAVESGADARADAVSEASGEAAADGSGGSDATSDSPTEAASPDAGDASASDDSAVDADAAASQDAGEGGD